MKVRICTLRWIVELLSRWPGKDDAEKRRELRDLGPWEDDMVHPSANAGHGSLEFQGPVKSD